jgi:L-ribulose-5-phosphate 4-epimerase
MNEYAKAVDGTETGYVKFRCDHRTSELGLFPGFDELAACRRKLLKLKMIGVDANGIGFGNLSIKGGTGNTFYITGSGTSGKHELTLSDIAKVLAYDFEKNWIRCEGPTIASSESLTHAAVYESDNNAGAVIHCHDKEAWKILRGQVPTTAAAIEYGTPAMANEVRRLFRETNLKESKILVMAGHEGGIVTFGKNLEEAFDGVKSAIER